MKLLIAAPQGEITDLKKGADGHTQGFGERPKRIKGSCSPPSLNSADEFQRATRSLG